MVLLLLIHQCALQQQLRTLINRSPANSKIHLIQSCKIELLSWSILYFFNNISGLRINNENDNNHNNGSNDNNNNYSINETGISYNDSNSNSGGDSDGYMKLEPLNSIQILINSCWIYIDIDDVKNTNNLFI